MEKLLFDIETDGFLDVVTKVHCISVINLETNESRLYDVFKGDIDEGIERLTKAKRLLGHNIIKYDVPVLEKLYPLNFDHIDMHDTLVMSLTTHPALATEDKDNGINKRLGKLTGSHGLEAWGIRMDEHKGSFSKETDWQEFTKEMGDYCEQDTKVNLKLYYKLQDDALSSDSLRVDMECARILWKQQQHGFLFNKELGNEILGDLLVKRADALTEVKRQFAPRFEPAKKHPKMIAVTLIRKDEAKAFLQRVRLEDYIAGEYKDAYNAKLQESLINLGYVSDITVPKRNNAPSGYTQGRPFTKIGWAEFNPGSNNQLAARLMELGWIPEDFTPSGNPKTDKDTLKAAAELFPEAKPIAEYLQINKMIGVMADGNQALLTSTKEDGRIHGDVKVVGTPHARMSHSKPNVAQVPKPSKKFGERFRECFTVPEGKVLIGIDASGIQLRMLAHYLAPYDEGRYIEACVNGDVHWTNACDLGLPGTEKPRNHESEMQDKARDNSKTYIYTTLFGGGLGLIASRIGYSINKTRKIQEVFYKRNPAFKVLQDVVRKTWRKRGFIVALDGRQVPCSSERLGLNYLLTSGEACVMKRALWLFNESLKAKGWVFGNEYAFVANVHDEWQIEALPEHADEIGRLGVASIKQAGIDLKVRCPLDGEAKIGGNWSETH